MLDNKYTSTPVTGRLQRFTRQHPCPVCGGYDQLERGVGRRCAGFLSSDAHYIHCSREELAGGLQLNANSSTYPHRATGPCRCGKEHAPAPAQQSTPPLCTARYDYYAADNSLRFQVLRFGEGKNKTFKQRRPAGNGWDWRVAGMALVLYQLPALLLRPTERVFLVEGEKDADALLREGLLATTNAMGAKAPWHPQYTVTLAGRDVVVLLDCDRDGRQRGERLANELAGSVKSLRIVDLAPERTDGYDLSDWLADGHTIVELESLADRAAPVPPPAREEGPFNWREHIMSARELLRKTFSEPQWAVPNLIPEGLSLFVGAPKIGKSWFMLDVTAAVAAGGKALGYAECAPGRALYLALEDGERLLQRRLRRQIGELDCPERLDIITAWRRMDDGGRADLDDYLTEHPDTRLVVVDTLARVRPRDTPGGGVYRQDYEALSPLADLARKHNVAIVVVHHTRKMQSDDVLDLVSGSNGLAGSVDAIMVLQRPRLGDEAVLTITGRDIEEQALAAVFDKERCRWAIEGDATEAHITKLQKEILETLEEAPEALQIRDIADRIGRANDSSLRHVLARMVKAGIAMLTRRGRYTTPPKDGTCDVVTCDVVTFADDAPAGTAQLGIVGSLDADHNVTTSQVTNTVTPCPGCGKRFTGKPAPYDPQVFICSRCGTELVSELEAFDF